MMTLIKVLLAIAVGGTVAYYSTKPTTQPVCRSLYDNSLSGAAFACVKGVASIQLSSKTHSPVDITVTTPITAWVQVAPAPDWRPGLGNPLRLKPGMPLRLENGDRKILYIQHVGTDSYTLTVAWEWGMYGKPGTP